MPLGRLVGRVALAVMGAGGEGERSLARDKNPGLLNLWKNTTYYRIISIAYTK